MAIPYCDYDSRINTIVRRNFEYKKGDPMATF